MKTATFITTIRLTIDEDQPDNICRKEVATLLEPQRVADKNQYHTNGLPNGAGVKVLIDAGVLMINSTIQYAHQQGIGNESAMLRYAIKQLETAFITPADITTASSPM